MIIFDKNSWSNIFLSECCSCKGNVIAFFTISINSSNNKFGKKSVKIEWKIVKGGIWTHAHRVDCDLNAAPDIKKII